MDQLSSHSSLVEVQNALYAAQMTKYAYTAALSLLLYEQLLTFDREVQCGWRHRRPTWGKTVFLLNRYLNLLALLATVGALCWARSNASCVFFSILLGASGVATVIAWSIFSGLRVYSVTNRNRFITVLVIFLGVVPHTVASVVYMARSNFRLQAVDSLHVVLCISRSPLDRVGRLLLIFSIIGGTLPELIVIATILQYSWRAYREVGKLMFLAHLLLREGMIYFLLLLCGYALNALAYTLPRQGYGTVAVLLASSQFILALDSIMVSRFFFKLDDWKHGCQKI